MKKIFGILLMALIAIGASAQCEKTACKHDGHSSAGHRWCEHRAGKWGAAQPWLSGCDYIPNNAINQIEMWSVDTWSPELIDKELGWAEDLGFNTMRVFLSSVVWENDAKGLKARMDEFLNICKKHGIRPHFVFFDDCWNEESAYGKQPEPKTGVHNSGWLRDPSMSLREDTATLYPKLEAYVTDILTTFGKDDRILFWDLYNEPGNNGLKGKSLPLVKKVFEWSRAANPSQPITIGIWNWSDPDFNELNAYSLNNSDIITYHNYSDADHHRQLALALRMLNRPMVCTEYMARTRGSKFQTVMPMLKDLNIGAINWGFVAGKTNTIYAWSAPMPQGGEPEVWFHDILRPDGTPYDIDEIDVIKKLNGKK